MARSAPVTRHQVPCEIPTVSSVYGVASGITRPGGLSPWSWESTSMAGATDLAALGFALARITRLGANPADIVRQLGLPLSTVRDLMRRVSQTYPDQFLAAVQPRYQACGQYAFVARPLLESALDLRRGHPCWGARRPGDVATPRLVASVLQRGGAARPGRVGLGRMDLALIAAPGRDQSSKRRRR
jgi:hypothetical protein